MYTVYVHLLLCTLNFIIDFLNNTAIFQDLCKVKVLLISLLVLMFGKCSNLILYRRCQESHDALLDSLRKKIGSSTRGASLLYQNFKGDGNS